MALENVCTPVILYIIFTITQIIIDTFKGMYNTALSKFIIMIGFVLILNILCEKGLGVISWLIVFIPFIMMTAISTLLLITFGFSPSKGKINYNIDYPKDEDNIRTTDLIQRNQKKKQHQN